jgi:hypothetical protein
VTIDFESGGRVVRSTTMKPLLIPIGLILAVLCVQGVRRHWRTTAVAAIKDCRTNELIDDGCDMFWSCMPREPICAPGTRAP